MGVIAWWILWELCAGVMVSRRPCMHMWGYSAQFWVVGFIGGSTEFLVGVIFFSCYGVMEFYFRRGSYGSYWWSYFLFLLWSYGVLL